MRTSEYRQECANRDDINRVFRKPHSSEQIKFMLESRFCHSCANHPAVKKTWSTPCLSGWCYACGFEIEGEYALKRRKEIIRFAKNFGPNRNRYYPELKGLI